MRVIFAGTPEFAAHQLRQVLKQYKVGLVLTQPDRPKGRGQKLQASAVKQVAIEHGIEVLQPENLKGEDIQNTLTAFKPDLMIVSAYGLLIPQWLLDLPKLGCWNVHASILPRWRGAAPIQYAIWKGDKQTGISLMQLEAGLDSGPVMLQSSIDIDPYDTQASLLSKLTQLGADVLLDGLSQASNLTSKPQDPKLVTLSPKITKDQAQVLWDETAVEIERKVRAFDPAPGCYCFYNNDRIKVFGLKILSQHIKQTPGEILHVSTDGIDVATQDGVVQLQTIQLPGKPRQSIKDILNAKPDLFKVGSHLT